MIVKERFSNVLSPAILSFLPLKPTSNVPIVEPGIDACLHKKDVNSTLAEVTYDGKLTVALNKEGLAPPPASFDLKSSMPNIAMSQSSLNLKIRRFL